MFKLYFDKISQLLFGNLSSSHEIELLKGGSISFILRVVGMILIYGMTIFITRYFGASVFGVFALSITFIQIFAILATLGFANVLLRFVSSYIAENKLDALKEVYKKSLIVAIPVIVLLSIFGFIFSSFIALNIFHKPTLTIPFQIASVTGLFYAIFVLHLESIRGLKRIALYTFLQKIVIPVIAIPILITIVYLLPNFLHAPLVAYLMGVIIATISTVIFFHKYSLIYKVQPSHEWNYKKLLQIAAPMLLSGSMFMLMQWTDTIMLGIFSTEEKVGIYSVALNLSMITAFILTSINSIAAPKFSELYATKRLKELGRMAQSATRIIFLSSIVPLLALTLFSTFFLGLFGAEFTFGKYALLILLIGQFFNIFVGSVVHILNMTGNHKILQYIILISAIANIILNFVLIPIYGIVGAAIASSISMILSNVGAMFAIKKYLGFYTVYIPFLRSKN